MHLAGIAEKIVGKNQGKDEGDILLDFLGGILKRTRVGAHPLGDENGDEVREEELEVIIRKEFREGETRSRMVKMARQVGEWRKDETTYQSSEIYLILFLLFFILIL